jgi:hypothetical protein
MHPAAEDFWPKFWRIYAKLKQADSGNLKRPAIGAIIK